MKEKALILTFILCSLLSLAQNVQPGTYIGDKEHGYQKLILNSDSTFDYEYRDPWATLMAGYSSGTWEIEKEKM